MKFRKYFFGVCFFVIFSAARGGLWAVDVFSPLQLVGQLQIFRADNQTTPIQEINLAVQLVPKDSLRPNSTQIVKFNPFTLDNLSAEPHLFRVNIFHRSATQGDIKLSSIETTIDVQPGSNIDFTQSGWRYDFDDDGDGFSNLTELRNGHLEAPPGGSLPTVWVNENTDPKDPAGHPTTVSLLKSSAISAMAPSSTGRLRIVGDPLSVQPGVQVTAVLRSSAGAQKGKFYGFSRLDGSFDLTLTGAAVGDKVEVFTASMPAYADDPAFTSFGTSTGPYSKKEFTVQDLSACP